MPKTTKKTKKTADRKITYTPQPKEYPIVGEFIQGSMFMRARMSNPQAEVDEDHTPRVDDKGYGYMTPQGLMYPIRRLCEMHGHSVWVQPGAVRNTAVDEVAIKVLGRTRKAKDGESGLSLQEERVLTRALSDQFIDIRMRGGVLAPYGVGIRGPLQLGFFISANPIDIVEIMITNCSIGSEEDAVRKDRDIGHMAVVRDSIYRMDFTINPHLAKWAGFTEEDVEFFLYAALQSGPAMASATRPDCNIVRIDLFRHSTPLGHSWDKVRETITVNEKDEIEVDEQQIQMLAKHAAPIRHQVITSISDLNQDLVKKFREQEAATLAASDFETEAAE